MNDIKCNLCGNKSDNKFVFSKKSFFGNDKNIYDIFKCKKCRVFL